MSSIKYIFRWRYLTITCAQLLVGLPNPSQLAGRGNGHSYLPGVLPIGALHGIRAPLVGSPDHHFQDVEMSQQQHIQTACNMASSLDSFDLWLIVGEWSPAITDCAESLNGRGVGSRYDGTYPGSTKVGSCTGFTGSASTFSSSYKTFLRQFWEAQVSWRSTFFT